MGTKIKKIFPLRIAAMTVARHHVNLLYISADETSHYVLVKDLSRLKSIQYNNHNDKHYFCQYCLYDCISEKVLENHMERCKLHGAQTIKLLKADEGGWRRGVTKSNLHKQNTNYIYLLLSTRISKALYVNKTRVSHRHRNPSPPNTCITYHVGAASTWNAVMDDILSHPKWI